MASWILLIGCYAVYSMRLGVFWLTFQITTRGIAEEKIQLTQKWIDKGGWGILVTGSAWCAGILAAIIYFVPQWLAIPMVWLWTGWTGLDFFFDLTHFRGTKKHYPNIWKLGWKTKLSGYSCKECHHDMVFHQYRRCLVHRQGDLPCQQGDDGKYKVEEGRDSYYDIPVVITLIPKVRVATLERWKVLWLATGMGRNDLMAAYYYKSLAFRYSEPQRYYHTIEHIDHCLTELDQVRASIPDPVAVEFALWFHDIYYDPLGKNNEELSAEVAAGLLLCRGASPAFAAKVAAMILATQHTKPALDRDTAFVVDIDLSSLGSPWNVFDVNTELIRQEYVEVKDKDWLEGRTKVLQMFLDRERIYYTDELRDKFEKQARENLKQAIAQLAAPPESDRKR